MDRRTKNVEIFKDSVELMPYFVAVMKLRIMMPSVKCLEQKMKVKLVKEPDNEYDKEAIKVEMPGIGHIGYVANSPYTVVVKATAPEGCMTRLEILQFPFSFTGTKLVNFLYCKESKCSR